MYSSYSTVGTIQGIHSESFFNQPMSWDGISKTCIHTYVRPQIYELLIKMLTAYIHNYVRVRILHNDVILCMACS